MQLLVLSAALCLPAEAASKKELEAKVQTLEAKVEELDKRLSSIEHQNRGPSLEDEAAARALYGEIMTAVGEADSERALELIDSLRAEYNDTMTAQRLDSLEKELRVVGKQLPDSWNTHVDEWFQGSAELGEGKVILVFFEEWCPHCTREVPALAERYANLQDQGIEVVGITKVTKSSTDEKVKGFLEERSVSYPILKENGKLSDHFAVRGIPASAVLVDGEVVWRGHPARLSDDVLTAILDG